MNRLRPSSAARRRAICLSYANGLLWAIGNGLVSSTLVTYLALQLGAKGVAISLIIAAPRVAGVLRLAAPAVFAWGAQRRIAGRYFCGRKPLCLGGYVASGLILVLIPYAAIQASRYGTGWGVAVLVLSWGAYHLLEYAATVALWSWLGDVYPRALRSRLVAGRERWKLYGRVFGFAASVALTVAWEVGLPDSPRWTPLAASASVGALLLIVAAVPLAVMPSWSHAPSARPVAPVRTLLVALADRRYRKLLMYSVSFALANGLTAAAQGLYPWRVLGIDYHTMVGLRAGLGAGQAALTRSSGRWLQRLGVRRVMTAAQLTVALGPLFFWLATPGPPWWAPAWIIMAYVAWIAYAPLNIGLDTLKISYADPSNNAPYVAVYYTVGDLANAAATLLGGWLCDQFISAADSSLAGYGWLFLIGWAARTAVAGFAWRLDEPEPRDRR
ncbi:MFS transporter [Botrimarina hoheduenensis]|uniref:Major Facilitator Superfamily protein n=1 Tax=Botrimarina hoheduenensis TaxID=2528000 RepID=A0A5C5WA92_9BACT|nr:MFS transporter [Botrimarina hoheduenensis]TWT47223.1 hypothetical protein Pla111_08350 [Botrimarina hoheduenensis]